MPWQGIREATTGCEVAHLANMPLDELAAILRAETPEAILDALHAAGLPSGGLPAQRVVRILGILRLSPVRALGRLHSTTTTPARKTPVTGLARGWFARLPSEVDFKIFYMVPRSEEGKLREAGPISQIQGSSLQSRRGTGRTA